MPGADSVASPWVVVFASGDGRAASSDLAQWLRIELAPEDVQVCCVPDYSMDGGDEDEALAHQLRSLCTSLPKGKRLVLAGHSRGARVAATLAESLGAEALLAFGYPFHGTRQGIDRGRIRALAQLQLPVLICQGTRDPHGNLDQVRGYGLPVSVELHWVPNAKHRFDAELLGSPACQAVLSRARDFLGQLLA